MMDLLKKVVDKGDLLGASQVEVYAGHVLSKTVVAEKGEIKMALASRSRGAGIRVLYKGGIGFAYTTSLSKEALEETIKKAIKVAETRGKDPYYKTFPSPQQTLSVKGLFFKETAEFPLDEMVEKVRYMVGMARNFDKRITSVASEFSISCGERFLVNSLGIESSEKYSLSTISVYSVAEDKGTMTSGYEFQNERDIRKLDYERVANVAAKMSIELLHPRKIETNVMEVLLKPIAVSQLIRPTLIRAVSADNVQEKRSFLIDKLGKQVTVEELTIVDNPLLEEGLRSRSFDAEGVASRELKVVENGVLKTFLYNSYTAQRAGVENTGHADRSVTSEPAIAPSNLIFEHKVKKDLEDLISETEKGVIANSVIGAHTANPVTGEFSVALGECMYIENGEIKYPVRQAMVGGNVLQLLGKIKCIGRDVRQVGSVITGTAVFEEVTVSG